MSDQSFINDLKSKERTAAENYFRNLIEFVKWTTTVTLAAIVWISAEIGSLNCIPCILIILSLLILCISLVFAVKSIKSVLDGSSNQ